MLQRFKIAISISRSSAALLMIFSVGLSLPASEIENGSFEEDEAGGGEFFDAGEPWENFGAPDTRVTNSSLALSGLQSLKTFGPFDFIGSGTGVSQAIEASPNMRYAGQVFAQQVTGDELMGENFGVYKLEFRDADGQLVASDDSPAGTPLLGYNLFESPVFDGNMPFDEWIELPVEGISPAGTEFAQVVIVQVQQGDDGDFAGGAIFWDDADLIASPIDACDLNFDGVCDYGDLEVIEDEIAAGTSTPADALRFLTADYPEGLGTILGDVNLDQLFNPDDLINIFAAGKYDTPASAYYVDGDYNFDQKFNSDDLIEAFASGNYDTGAGLASAVPEPGSALLASLATLGLLLCRRQYRF